MSVKYLTLQTLSANASGDMKLSVETDMVAVSTHFQNLPTPTWSEYCLSFSVELMVFWCFRSDKTPLEVTTHTSRAFKVQNDKISASQSRYIRLV